jgi:hypothetical protein
MRTRLIFISFIAILAAFFTLAAHAAGNPYPHDRGRNDHRDHGRSERVDDRYSHNRSYPVRGYVAPALPRGYVNVRYRGSPYYFYRGSWYRPYGPRYIVAAPPFGIGLAYLPPFYTTVWFGGVPYYYADDTYYLWRPERREYVVSRPPSDSGEVHADSGGSDDVFVYPKNGQSAEQQSTDRYECHSWAVQQTGFDPTRPHGNVDESDAESKRTDYRRAEGACLEARGYSVK